LEILNINIILFIIPVNYLYLIIAGISSERGNYISLYLTRDYSFIIINKL